MKSVKKPPPRTVAPTSDELATKMVVMLNGEELRMLVKAAVEEVLADERRRVPHRQPEWLTSAQAAKALGKSERWLGPHLRSGAIMGTMVGNAWRVSREEIERVQREGLREV